MGKALYVNKIIIFKMPAFFKSSSTYWISNIFVCQSFFWLYHVYDDLSLSIEIYCSKLPFQFEEYYLAEMEGWYVYKTDYSINLIDLFKEVDKGLRNNMWTGLAAISTVFGLYNGDLNFMGVDKSLKHFFFQIEVELLLLLMILYYHNHIQ